MISITDLEKSYGGRILLKDAGFQVNSKERVGIIGRNGSGKTTILKMIAGVEHPDQGEVVIPRNYTIGYLEQHRAFSHKNVLEEVCSALPPERRHETWHAEKLMCGLGYSEEDLNRETSEFSSGYQIRISLAKALAAQPNMLLLDEPTNYLDIISIRWLGRFLKSWDGEIILVTHDRHFMDSIATHIVSIHRQGTRKMPGTTEKILSQVMQEEEIHEKTRTNEEKKRKQEELFISRFRAKARLAGMVQSRIKALEKRPKLDKLQNSKNLKFSFTCAPSKAKYLMNVKDLSFAYDPSTPPIINNFSIDIGSNERIAVIGKNGRGKSTLLRLLKGDLQPNSGEMQLYQGLKVGHYSETSINSLNPMATVEDEIHYSDPGLDKKSARDICGAMMFEGDNALKKISVLSGGEKSRVCLGKLIVSPCNILLLDEPTNHLDQDSCESLIEAINKFPGTVVIVTHNERLLEAIPSRLVVFDNDDVRIYTGSYKDFLSRIGWSDEKELRESPTQNQRFDSKNKKELRRKKADILKRKTQTLSEFKNKIDTLEKRIIVLEKQTNQKNLQLIEASEQSNGTAIAGLSADIKDLQWKVDELYSRLDIITREYEEKEAVFNREMEEL